MSLTLKQLLAAWNFDLKHDLKLQQMAFCFVVFFGFCFEKLVLTFHVNCLPSRWLTCNLKLYFLLKIIKEKCCWVYWCFKVYHKHTKSWYISYFSVGYKPFFHAIRGQIQVLTKLAEQTPPTLQLNTSMESIPASVEEGNLSPGVMTIRSDSESPQDSPPCHTDQPKPSECVLSW